MMMKPVALSARDGFEAPYPCEHLLLVCLTPYFSEDGAPTPVSFDLRLDLLYNAHARKRESGWRIVQSAETAISTHGSSGAFSQQSRFKAGTFLSRVPPCALSTRSIASESGAHVTERCRVCTTDRAAPAGHAGRPLAARNTRREEHYQLDARIAHSRDAWPLCVAVLCRRVRNVFLLGATPPAAV